MFAAFNDDDSKKDKPKPQKGYVYTFDIIEEEQYVKSLTKPSEVYEYFEWLSKKYTTNEIGKYQYDNLKDTVMERLNYLSTLKNQIDSK